jgi:hypothetical protein
MVAANARSERRLIEVAIGGLQRRNLWFWRDIRPGLRSKLLLEMAYFEEGLAPPVSHQIKVHFGIPYILLYPRSYVERVCAMPHEKEFDFCFAGALYAPSVFENRKWILDFARSRFTARSYFCITDPPPSYVSIGEFDRTLDRAGNSFVPRMLSGKQKLWFDENYFRTMCQSQFTLCPAGDQPWSMRFFESIMCKSTPIVERTEHCGRNKLERSIGYQLLRASQALDFSPDVCESNYDLFVSRQTLVGIRQS